MPRQQLKKLGLNITYEEGLPETYGNARGEPSLIVLDDLLTFILRSLYSMFAFTLLSFPLNHCACLTISVLYLVNGA